MNRFFRLALDSLRKQKLAEENLPQFVQGKYFNGSHKKKRSVVKHKKKTAAKLAHRMRMFNVRKKR